MRRCIWVWMRNRMIVVVIIGMRRWVVTMGMTMVWKPKMGMHVTIVATKRTVVHQRMMVAISRWLIVAMMPIGFLVAVWWVVGPVSKTIVMWTPRMPVVPIPVMNSTVWTVIMWMVVVATMVPMSTLPVVPF